MEPDDSGERFGESRFQAFLQRRVLVRVVLIALSFVTVSIALLSIESTALNYWYLYYSPVLLAAYSFGLRGAAIASVLAALHVVALREWALLASARYVAFAERLLEMAGSPPRQIGEGVSRLAGASPEAIAWQALQLMRQTPDLTNQSIQAALGLALLVVGALLTGWLVDQNRRKEEMLMRLATVDGLTGVFNHRAFRRRLREEINRGSRSGRAFGLLMIDIDHFKQINDLHGHLAGDAGLQQVARRICDSVRGVDTVARYGGEEFAVLLVDIEQDSTGTVANRIRSSIESDSFELRPDVVVPLTVSIGYAVFPRDAADADGLIDKADAALYFAKTCGRNRCIEASDLPPSEPSDGSALPDQETAVSTSNADSSSVVN